MNIETSCKECVFLKNDDCKLGILQKFKDLGVEVTNGPTIQGRICLYKRSKKWLDSNKGKNILSIISQEIKPTCDCIIVFDRQSRLDGLDDTIKSILRSRTNFSNIIIALNTNRVNPSFIKTLMRKTQCPNWSIEVIFESNTTNNRAVDIVVKNRIKSRYYCRINVGYILTENITEYLHTELNEKLLPIVYIQRDDNMVLANVDIHKCLGGNTNMDLGEKIKEVLIETEMLSNNTELQ